jgi:hypothetical protein
MVQVGIKGIRKYNGDETVESSAIFHIPLMQYDYAYNEYVENNIEFSGGKRETVSGAKYDPGMFDAILELGSTKNVIVGHDHINDFSLMYQDVRLTYGIKTGNGSYYMKDGSINGGTVLTIDENNNTYITQKYVPMK